MHTSLTTTIQYNTIFEILVLEIKQMLVTYALHDGTLSRLECKFNVYRNIMHTTLEL